MRLLPLLLVHGACSGAVAIKVKDRPSLAPTAQKAPVFTATDHRGRPVSLAAARAAGPVVLVFYRGHW